MNIDYSKIELLAFIKCFNRTNDDKIRNIDKLKKEDLYEICKKYSLIQYDQNSIVNDTVIFKNISKEIILQNIELHFLKNEKQFPTTRFTKMKKRDLLNYVNTNNINHYTPDMIKREIEYYENKHFLQNIIYYNLIRFGNNIEPSDAMTKRKDELIYFDEYLKLFQGMFSVYERFCENTGRYIDVKSLPDIIENLQELVRK